MGRKVVSIIIFALLNACPILFLIILCCNRGNLDKAEIKGKIGTLYAGLRPHVKSVWSHSVVFLLRRLLFVIITFALFSQPNLQVQLFILVTLFYITFMH